MFCLVKVTVSEWGSSVVEDDDEMKMVMIGDNQTVAKGDVRPIE